MERRAPARSSLMTALGYSQFRLLWLGYVVSNVGTFIQQFGLGWLVVELAARDGNPALGPLYLGLVGAARAVPQFACGLFAGVVADRVDRRNLLIVTQGAAGVLAALFAAVTLLDLATLPVIMLLSALGAVVFAFDGPTRHALMPRMVPDHLVVSAIGLISAGYNTATILGPLIGGLLIGSLGVGGLMVLNAVSFLAIIGALLALPPAPPPAVVKQESVLASLTDGLRYVKQEPVIRWIMLVLAVNVLLARPQWGLLPAIARDALHVGAVELSWLLAAAGGGQLCGALLVATLGDRRGRREPIVLLAGVGTGLCCVLFAMQTTLLPALVLLAGAATGAILLQATTQAVNQLRTPDEYRGRVLGVAFMIVQTSIPLGTMLLGALSTVTGVGAAVGLGGAIVTVVSLLVLIRVPALRAAASRPRA